METTIPKSSKFRISNKTRETLLDVIAYLFIALFIYTAASKLIEFERFQKVLESSPLIGNISSFLSWMIPTVEILLSFLLIIPAARKLGLRASLILMLAFTTYLLWMVLTGGEHLPCSCGGVIASMSWKQHIAFNIGLIALILYGLRLFPKK